MQGERLLVMRIELIKEVLSMVESPTLIESQLPASGERERWATVDVRGNVLAAASIWTPEGLHYGLAAGHRPRRAGAIGRYEAHDRRAGQTLLTYLSGRLAEAGCDIVVGPMDGDTWHAYRLVTESQGEPAFFLEPHAPRDYVADFTAAGFRVIERYHSSLNANVQTLPPPDPRVRAAADAIGGTLRPLDLTRFAAEVRAIYLLSLEAFADNILYVPIDEATFMAMYERLRLSIDPELCLMYERAGELIGFVFAIPDHQNNARPGYPPTCIVKTIARKPGRAFAQAGTVLGAAIRTVMCERGYERAIHALMHEANRSAAISAHTAVPMRRYALFGKTLT